jgi:hypothetical protein
MNRRGVSNPLATAAHTVSYALGHQPSVLVPSWGTGGRRLTSDHAGHFLSLRLPYVVTPTTKRGFSH